MRGNSLRRIVVSIVTVSLRVGWSAPVSSRRFSILWLSSSPALAPTGMRTFYLFVSFVRPLTILHHGSHHGATVFHDHDYNLNVKISFMHSLDDEGPLKVPVFLRTQKFNILSPVYMHIKNLPLANGALLVNGH